MHVMEEIGMDEVMAGNNQGLYFLDAVCLLYLD